MTDKKTDVWMPLWIGAYLADTMKLTTIQHGAYFLLLIAYWRERKPLEDNDDELRSITKLERAEWKRNRPVLEKFFRVADGVWWHKRVEQEIADADKRSKAASSKASKAAQARWEQPEKDAPSIAPSIAKSNAQGVLAPCPTPSPIEEKDPKGSSSTAGAAAAALTPVQPSCPHERVRALYHEVLPALPSAKLWGNDRQAALRARWGEMLKLKGWTTTDEGLEWFRRFFEAVADDDWLMGRTTRSQGHEGWECSIDYLLSPKGFRKVFESAGRARVAA